MKSHLSLFASQLHPAKGRQQHMRTDDDFYAVHNTEYSTHIFKCNNLNLFGRLSSNSIEIEILFRWLVGRMDSRTDWLLFTFTPIPSWSFFMLQQTVCIKSTTSASDGYDHSRQKQQQHHHTVDNYYYIIVFPPFLFQCIFYNFHSRVIIFIIYHSKPSIKTFYQQFFCALGRKASIKPTRNCFFFLIIFSSVFGSRRRDGVEFYIGTVLGRKRAFPYTESLRPKKRPKKGNAVM